MTRSSVLGTLPIVALFFASLAMSAPREDLAPQKFGAGEIHRTRQAEVLGESQRLLEKERFDVSREDELLHRLSRVVKEPLPREIGGGQKENSITTKPLAKNDTKETLRLNTEKSEVKDLMESRVAPQDDDDDNSTSSSDNKRSKSEGRSSRPRINIVSTLPPEIFPEKGTADIRTFTPQWWKERLNLTKYTTEETETNAAGNETETTTISVMVVPIELDEAKVQSPIAGLTRPAPPMATPSSAPPTTESITTTTTQRVPATSASKQSEKIGDNPTTTTDQPTSSSLSPAELKLHEKTKPPPRKMPAGVVALIIALSFAIVVVVTYIGFIIRRRIIEWRYGNRELLVNDFDAADINNFEL